MMQLLQIFRYRFRLVNQGDFLQGRCKVSMLSGGWNFIPKSVNLEDRVAVLDIHYSVNPDLAVRLNREKQVGEAATGKMAGWVFANSMASCFFMMNLAARSGFTF